MTPGSVIAISTKTDVLNATFQTRQRAGRCFAFDPTQTMTLPHGVERVGWSPLLSSGTWEHAVLNADAMVGASTGGVTTEGSHWLERAGALLATFFHAAALGDLPMSMVLSSVNRRQADEFLELLARHDANLALDLLTGICATDMREQSGIWSTASGVLAAYRTDAALASTEPPPIDWDHFLRVPTTLYVTSPSDHQHHLAPVIAGLLRDLRSYCYARAREVDANTQGNVLLVLDELANIAPLHDLPALISEGASQGILTLASLQDLSQARARWGIAGEGFLSLFGAKIILGGIGDRKTLENLSVLAGDRYVATNSATKRRHLMRWVNGGTQHSMIREPRLAPSEIANPAAHRATTIIGARVSQCNLTPYYKG